MNQFWKWVARGVLRENHSALWVWTCVGCIIAYAHIGWWAIVYLVAAVFPISFLEVWWNEYADDYDDLEEDA